MNIHADKYGSDNYFQVDVVVDGKPANVIWDTSDTMMEGNTDYSGFECLDPRLCYRFTIYDRNGDGMCCKYGKGGYDVSWGETLLKSSNFIGGSSESIQFGNCE